MNNANDKSLNDIYSKEKQDTLDILATLKQKAKTAAELQEIRDIEEQLKEIKPDLKAIEIYDQRREQRNVITTTLSPSEFANIKNRLNFFLYVSAGLFIFSIFIVPRLAVSQNSPSYQWLWYQLLFAIVLAPILTIFIYRYESLGKFIYRMTLVFFPAMLWGLLSVRLVFLFTPVETVDALITQYDSLRSNKLNSCEVTIKTDIELLDSYAYPLPCRQDLKEHDKVVLRYRQNFIGIQAYFEKT